MTRKILRLTLLFAFGITLGHVVLPRAFPSLFAARTVMAQSSKPVVKITRIYTGQDEQSHAEEMEIPFDGNTLTLLPVTGAEVHRGAAGSISDWHPDPQSMYVITLSGHGEIETSGGKKIPLIPGQLELVEDTHGKGHITRVTGTEDRVTLWLPLKDQTRH